MRILNWDTPNISSLIGRLGKVMENCSSGYQPSNIVESFHNIPHVDVDLGEINSTYEQTVEEYFEVSFKIVKASH